MTERSNFVIAVDIDGVLTQDVEGWGEEAYLIRCPNESTIQRVNKLYDQGYYIMLFTARHSEDRDVTERWLKEHNVMFHEIRFDKPHYNVFIDDRAICQFVPEIASYNFHRSCWRYSDGRDVSSEEAHPCFFCGEAISLTSEECVKCGIMICPHCGKCLCNIPILTRATLHRIHKKYCCNLPSFTGIIELDGLVDQDLIKRCEPVLCNCYDLEFKQGEKPYGQKG